MPTGNRYIERQDKIKTEQINWMYSARDKNYWSDLVNATLNFLFFLELTNTLTTHGKPWATAKQTWRQCGRSASARSVVRIQLSFPTIILAHQSSLSKKEGDYEVGPEAVPRSPGIYLTVEENPGLGGSLEAI